MPTATIKDNGRITIPASIRRRFGWKDGFTGVLTPFDNGFVFTFRTEPSTGGAGTVPAAAPAAPMGSDEWHPDDFTPKTKAEREAAAALRRKAFGCMKGKMWMADDFNETPDCFRDYV